jgi:hypothetical protein
VKKKAISGSIDPRWPKPKVVKWLEIGAIPAIVGLWLPDWLGAYAHGVQPYLPPLVSPFPPLVAYAGAVILLVACYQGIKDMGGYFLGVKVSGGLCLLFAVASVVLQLAGLSVASLVATGFAAVFAAGFFWFTIGKIAEITQETRARITWWAVAASTVATAVVYLGGVFLYATGQPSSFLVLRLGILLLTLTFGLCRYGVHIYKTQTSLGAAFAAAPDEQYWATTTV